MPYSFNGRYYDKYKSFFSYDYKDYSFKVDLQTGELYFTRKLISFSGKHVPLNLSLKYSQMHVNAYDNLYSYTGFPRGFKTNYHIVLEYDSTYDRYIYEDLDGYKHHFELAESSSSLYYDTFGSGLMLVSENNGYKIFDDDGNYQIFDQYGRLTSISKKITSGYIATQTISYLNTNDLKISSITDNYGRTINFSYASSSVQISYGNSVVITLHLNNYLLTKLSKNIGGHLLEDTFNQSSLVLTNILLSDEKTFEFTYSNDQIGSFITNIGQDIFTFEYGLSGDTWATVTNARGVSTRYDFSEEQTASQTSNGSNNLAYLRINSDIASCLIKEGISNNEITDFTFGNDNSLTIDTSSHTSGDSNLITNNNLQPKKMYLFVAEISGNLATGSFKLQLFDNDNHLLAELLFTGQTKILSFPVGICSSTQKKFKLHYSNNCPNHISIEKACLMPLIGDFELLCSNIDLGGPIFFYDDEPHYLLKNSAVAVVNNNYILQKGYSFKNNDYLANEKNFYKNNVPHLWCNDQNVLIDNATNVLTMANTSQFIAFNKSSQTIVYCENINSSITPQSNLSFYLVKGKDDNSFSITKISHHSPSFHTGFTSYYYEEEITKYVAGSLSSITYKDYDENYSLIEVNRNDGYKEKYSYDSHTNLTNETISHTSINNKISHEYFYDSNDNLEYEEHLVDSIFTGTEYEYDDFGNISEIHYPNNSKQGFLYDNVTGERDLETSFGHDNIVSFKQYNNYIDENHYMLQTDYNHYRFNYVDGHLSEVKFNNQQILNITYETVTFGNHTFINKETINYSNGGSIYTEYDEFDRVYICDTLTYYYDALYGNLEKFNDHAINPYNAFTFYTYDYFNQVTNVNTYYNSFSLDFTYDIYRRLISQTYCRSNSAIYSVSYTYYNKPDLENVIKSSSIVYGTTSINVTNVMDAFSRLTSQAVIIGTNNGIGNTFSYCEAGSNSPYTNRLIKSVSYTYINNGQPSSNNIEDEYAYDFMGNIASVTRLFNNSVSSEIQYVYDHYSRLIRENNQKINKTFIYSYDNEGNITSKKEYPYSTAQNPTNLIHTYSYFYQNTFSNKLTSFDGSSIAYDTAGNPITYRGKTMLWEKGTLLSQVNDGTSYTNLYYDGLKQRVRKITNSLTTYYQYINGQLIAEEQDGHSITYLYSHNGVVGFVLSGYDSSLNLNGVYFYEKNIQQDVISIRNLNNQIMAIYQYDAWGNHIVLTPSGQSNNSPEFIGNINPIRYRSYYYDADLKMYWLTTRYYDPEVGRFISPDHYSYLDYKKLHGINLYAYSRNNPVMYCDPSGHFLITLLTAIMTTAIATATAVAGLVLTGYGAGLGLNAIKRHGSNKESELPESEKDIYLEDPYTEDGVVIHYNIDKSKGNQDEYILQVYESWKYTEKEIDAFLKWLKYDQGYSNLDIGRVKNEWLWHNAMYGYGIATDSTGRVDIYLNAADPTWGWFFDFFRVW